MRISCRQILACIIRTLQWALPEWERGVRSPYGWWLLLHRPAWEGTYGQDHCIIHAALASTQVVFVSTVLATAARLLAACKYGAALPACVPWAKLFFSSSFPFPSSFHGPRIQFADRVPFSTFLAKMWCLQIKYAMNTMKIRSICQI